MSAHTEERLFQLMEEIERAWITRRDNVLVHELAAKNPDLAEELYLFFADVVGAADALSGKPERLGKVAERVKKWVESEGFAWAAVAQATTTDTTAAVSGQSPEPATPVPKSKPFLGVLKDSTGKAAKDLAAAMDITVDFLADVSNNAAALTKSARRELAKRAYNAWGISEQLLLASLDPGSMTPVQRAASRDKAYRPEIVTYADLVTRSQLDEDRKRFWLGLA